MYKNGSVVNFTLFVLVQAITPGRDAVAAVVRREKVIATTSFDFSTEFPVFSQQYTPDDYMNKLLAKFVGTKKNTASYTPGDGNCLYHAVSLAVFGDTSASMERRARTAIELAVNRQHYDGDDFTNVSEGYDNELRAASSLSQYGDILALIALANVIEINVLSVYPPVNGLTDRAFQYLNTTVHPRCGSSKSISITWTYCGATKQPIWTPNHFVALLRIAADDSATFVVDSSPLHSSTPVNSRCDVPDNVSDDTCDDVADDVSDDVADDGHTHVPVRRLIEPTEIFNILRDSRVVQSAIPAGMKSDVMFVVDNSANVARRQRNQHSVFSDDCGIWISKASITTRPLS